jgi:putative transposase
MEQRSLFPETYETLSDEEIAAVLRQAIVRVAQSRADDYAALQPPRSPYRRFGCRLCENPRNWYPILCQPGRIVALRFGEVGCSHGTIRSERPPLSAPPATPASPSRNAHVDLSPGNWTVLNEKIVWPLSNRRDLAVKQSRFSEQQIAFILHQAEAGVAVEEVCRKAGISIQTYYRWRKKYGGLMPSEMKRLKLLEEENAKLKRLVADLSLDKVMLQDVVKRKL